MESGKLIKTKIKVGDNVVVISGASAGKRGKVLAINKEKARVVVEGVNKRDKYLRPSQANPQGGKVNIEFPIHISNVMYFCDKCKKGTRIGIQVKDNNKTRVCKGCGKSIDK